MDIYIFRHGETNFNVENRLQGSIDIPLNENGRQQAAQLAGKLKRRGIEAILSSPLSRAQETAEIVAAELVLPVSLFDELREIQCGEAEGRHISDLKASYGDEFWQKWRSVRSHDFDLRFPGGESKRECQDRISQFVNALATSSRHNIIGIASHGAIIRYLIHSIVGDSENSISVGNCAVFLLRFCKKAKRWDLVQEKL